MPTLATPATLSSSQLTPDQLTVIVASISCLVFFVVIVVLLTILYRKDPLCCKVRAYQESHQYSQPGHVFVIGQASSYHLPSMDAPLPRLPSYESVRKKDRQRQIHMMIADRFGLNGTIETEPPPTYEESIRQSVVIPSVNFGSTDNLVASVAATQSTVPPHLGSQQNPSTCHDPNT
ncbi:uncharacterized protein si:ch73-364h19.1 isoform X3 [Anguilla rostrata]|uniref:uncharacterized protein si:ch73-364h19.1 isoform X3 n=1 Tax=Anguilla rostrata TaxID=7938 RepID=UPI0030D3BD24